MDCKKCHGWKQKEYHPIIYCKNKRSDSSAKNKSDSFTSSEGARQKTEAPYASDKKKSQILLKKLGPEFTGKTNLESIVQKIYNKKNPQKQLYAPGAPFFKNTARIKIKSQSEKGDAFKE